MIDGARRALLVVGPPGEATGAVGRSLERLGVRVVADDDVLATGRDALLRAHEATASAPPELDRLGAAIAADVPEVVGAALAQIRAELDRGSAEGPVVWVDPANAFLLPVLRHAMADALAVVVAWGPPEATVAALGTEGVRPAHALALWEAHVVHALRGAVGLPVLGVDAARPDAGAIVELLEHLDLEILGPVDAPPAVDALPAPPASPADPEVAALAAVVDERLRPTLAAAVGVHKAWEPPGPFALTLGPTADAILTAERAAFRSALEAAAAWVAVHTAETVASDAKAAVEADHRALVGPDPMHYLELRRELWRARDDFAGLVAERAHYRTAWMRADAQRLTTEQRIADLFARLHQLEAERDRLRAERDTATRERDEMLGSERWRVGGLLLEPLKRLRNRSHPR